MFNFIPNEFEFRTAAELTELIRAARATKRLVYGEVTVTPEMAAHMLERKCDSIRTPGQSDVDGYVRDLREKSFDFNGAGIKLDKKGKMFDGQKRCMACIASGKPFKTMIFFNSPPLNVNGEQRQATAERMTLPNRSMCAALAKLFHMEDLGQGIFDSGHKLTPREVRQFQTEEGDELTRLARLIQPLQHVPMSRHAHYAFFASKMEEALDDTEVVKEFFDQLGGGAERGTPVMKLRNRLARDYAREHGTTRLTLTEKCHFLVRTFVADFTGEDLGKLQLPKNPVTQKSILALLEEL